MKDCVIIIGIFSLIASVVILSACFASGRYDDVNKRSQSRKDQK